MSTISPSTQARIDHIVSLVYPWQRKALRSAVEHALVQESLAARQSCERAIDKLSRMTISSDPNDPGIKGVNLAFEAAREACAKPGAI